MKQLGQFINEAKATYCGRCDTTHVPPSKGGTCPALKEGSMSKEKPPFEGGHKIRQHKDEYGNVIKNLPKHLAKKAMQTNEEIEELDETAKIVAHLQKRYGDNIRKSHVASAAKDFGVDASKLAKAVRKKLGKTMLDEEADKGIRIAKVMHKGKHVANVVTYRGRGGNWVSGAETPDGQNATKKYGIGLIDTKKEILKKIKQHHKENDKTMAESKITVKKVSAADQFKKLTGQATTKSKVPVDPKTGKTLYQKVTTEEAEQLDELSPATLGSYTKKAAGSAAGVAAAAAGSAAIRGKASEYDKRTLRNRLTGISRATDRLTKEEVEELDEVSAAKLRDYADKASDARGHRNLPTAKLDKRYKSMALAHEKIRQRHAMVPATEETMKTLSQFINEAKLNEAHDVELKPHSNGTHYIVHKIHPSSGIEKDQLKVGEKISDTHVDDLHDMGYSVKIHKK